MLIQQNSSRELQANRDYKWHLEHTDIGHTFSDDQIALLASQKNEINAEIGYLSGHISETNPNVQILA